MLKIREPSLIEEGSFAALSGLGWDIIDEIFTLSSETKQHSIHVGKVQNTKCTSDLHRSRSRRQCAKGGDRAKIILEPRLHAKDSRQQTRVWSALHLQWWFRSLACWMPPTGIHTLSEHYLDFSAGSLWQTTRGLSSLKPHRYIIILLWFAMRGR